MKKIIFSVNSLREAFDQLPSCQAWMENNGDQMIEIMERSNPNIDLTSSDPDDKTKLETYNIFRFLPTFKTYNNSRVYSWFFVAAIK